MSEQQLPIEMIEQEEEEEENNENNNNNNTECAAAAASRKERRKAAKRDKRKKKRKYLAEMARQQEEARLNDPDELMRLQAEEEEEKLRVERERREFEERERKILEDWERKRALEEEERRRKAREEEERRSKLNEGENEVDEDGWEYVEEGPPEIIWQGNEIIVKKKKIRVKKKEPEQQILKEDLNRPTSNPLPPQSEAFADYRSAPVLSARQLMENVAQETPNFGTEQDKAHCPFHLKTGACRFGTHCSRIHFYPDKSCTLLIKNMYSGPGLAWEQDEGLEHTDEEVEHAYEEFYEDVHTEFLKFGEIVNFKVCRNGSSHLRGNVYVHYKDLDSAVTAYQSVNGRYFAGKQVQCEFVGVTRWKVAICGEFMKSKLQTCSRGITCNFIHCFRNPGGDYEWADWDKPPPRYWLKKMAALFGYSDEFGYDRKIDRGSPRYLKNSSRTTKDDADRYRSRRSQSRETDYSRSSRDYSKNEARSSSRWRRSRSPDRKQADIHDIKSYRNTSNSRKHEYESSDSDSDRNSLDPDKGRKSSYDSTRNRSRTHSNRKLESRGGHVDETRMHESEADANMSDRDRNKYNHCRYSRSGSRTNTGNLTCDLSDREGGSAHVYTELSPQSDGSEELGDRKSKRRSVHRRHREGEDDGLEQGNCGRNHKPESSPRYHSREDTGKKSKRKREAEKYNYDSESRREYNEVKRSHPEKREVDEAAYERGRWEPDKTDSADHESF